LVTAALLHDIGHLILDEVDDNGNGGHERVGAQALSALFGPAVCAPVALHVAAKRFLCATETAYAAGLSAASRRSLAAQGGAFDPAAAAAFARLPDAAAAVVLRRCDDGGKHREAVSPRFSDFVPLLRAVVGSHKSITSRAARIAPHHDAAVTIRRPPP
jgi:predicted HD phosphohydrolase